MLELLSDPAAWLSFATLVLLEIILGIDNIIFISIVSQKLPQKLQAPARQIGLILALAMRVVLLISLVWIIKLVEPVFSIFDFDFSWRDLILLGGGLFLLAKATVEIYETVEGNVHDASVAPKPAGFASVIIQIILLDIVFSFDSILTAVGLTDHLPIMIAAVVVAILVMMLAAEPVSAFVNRHLSVKILALAFLLLIGAVLVADGLHFHIPKGYIYFSVAFSLSVQVLAILAGERRQRRAVAKKAAEGGV